MPTNTTSLRRLYLIQVATLPPMNSPIPCYLVQTADGKNILIDSGLPTTFSTPPGRSTPVLGKNVFEQLALLDIQPGDIDVLVCTHFDLDHCGHNDDFPNARLIVQREQYDAARGGHQRFARSSAYWDLPASRYDLIDGDIELLPGFELVESGGHTPGHQSVLLRLPETGSVLLTIDAVTQGKNFRLDRPVEPVDLDGERTIASTRKLFDLAQREHVALVIFGHDGQQWETLKKLPEYYG